MRLLVSLRIAWRALAKNKLRAGLTLLGVVIGIAAVTTMVSIGQSATALVQGQLEGLGTNVLVILPGTSRAAASQAAAVTLKAEDAEEMPGESPAVLAATPLLVAAAQPVVYGNLHWQPKQLFGVGPTYLTVRNWMLRSGDFFSDREVHTQAPVCVIGPTVVGKRFQTANPIGQIVRIKNPQFRVSGVLEAHGANLVGDDQDDVVLMPYSTVQRRLQGTAFDHVQAIMASART